MPNEDSSDRDGPGRAQEDELVSRDVVNHRLYHLSDAAHAKVQTIKVLLEGSPAPNIASRHGPLLETALHAASMAGNVEIVRYLVEKGRRLAMDGTKYLDISNENGDTALHLAVSSQILDCLLKGGADATVRNSEGCTPAHLAARSGRKECLYTLIRHNPSQVNDKTVGAGEQTCLHYVARRGYKSDFDEIVFLQSHGADLKATNLAKETAWDYAFWHAELYQDGRSGFANVSDRSWFWVCGNNAIGIFALINKLFPEAIGINRLYHKRLRQFLSETFSERHVSRGFLRFREPHFRHWAPAAEHTPVVNTAYAGRPDFVSIVMPYLCFENYSVIESRRREYDEFINNTQFPSRLGRDGDLAPYDAPVHLPLTLDEFCGPALDPEVLADRHADQVLVRYQVPQGQQNRPLQLTTKMVIVRQAWFWKLGDQFITAYSGNQRYHLSQKILERETKYDHLYRVGLMLSLLIEMVNSPIEINGGEQTIFNVFQQSITRLSEDVKSYLEADDDPDMSINDKVRLDKDRKYFHEIGDIREELSMLKSVLYEQEGVWQDFTHDLWPKLWQDGRPLIAPEHNYVWEEDAWETMTRAQQTLQKSKRAIEHLEKNADRVERSMIVKLDVKHKYASLQAAEASQKAAEASLEEARASVREAHSSTTMSAAVVGFTVITVIFTPLAFMVSLFALPLESFPPKYLDGTRSTDNGASYRSRDIGGWIFLAEVVSIAVTIFAMWLAHDVFVKEKSMIRKPWHILKGRRERKDGSSSDPAIGRPEDDRKEMSKVGRGEKLKGGMMAANVRLGTEHV